MNFEKVEEVKNPAKVKESLAWLKRIPRPANFYFKARCEVLGNKPLLLLATPGRKVNRGLIDNMKGGSRGIRGQVKRRGRKLQFITKGKTNRVEMARLVFKLAVSHSVSLPRDRIVINTEAEGRAIAGVERSLRALRKVNEPTRFYFKASSDALGGPALLLERERRHLRALQSGSATVEGTVQREAGQLVFTVERGAANPGQMAQQIVQIGRESRVPLRRPIVRLAGDAAAEVEPPPKARRAGAAPAPAAAPDAAPAAKPAEKAEKAARPAKAAAAAPAAEKAAKPAKAEKAPKVDPAAEAARQAEEARKAEEARRSAEEKKKRDAEEAARQAEERARKAEEARQAEEARKKAEAEARRAAEEERKKAEEAAKAAELARRKAALPEMQQRLEALQAEAAAAAASVQRAEAALSREEKTIKQLKAMDDMDEFRDRIDAMYEASKVDLGEIAEDIRGVLRSIQRADDVDEALEEVEEWFSEHKDEVNKEIKGLRKKADAAQAKVDALAAEIQELEA